MKTRWCALCDIWFNLDVHPSCPMCLLKQENKKLQKLLKMAEDECVASDDHGREQSRRADNLEAELEELRSRIESNGE